MRKCKSWTYPDVSKKTRKINQDAPILGFITNSCSYVSTFLVLHIISDGLTNENKNHERTATAKDQANSLDISQRTEVGKWAITHRIKIKDGWYNLSRRNTFHSKFIGYRCCVVSFFTSTPGISMSHCHLKPRKERLSTSWVLVLCKRKLKAWH